MNPILSRKLGPAPGVARFLPGNLALLVGIACIASALVHQIKAEPPTGSVYGSVTLTENGKPLSGAQLTLQPIVRSTGTDEDDPSGGPEVREVRTGINGRYRIGHVPVGEYYLSANSRAHSAANSYLYVSEGGATPQDLTVNRSMPELQIKEHQRVFGTREDTHLPISGYVDANAPGRKDKVRLRVFKTRLSSVLQNSEGESILQQIGQSYGSDGTQGQKDGRLPKSLLKPEGGAAPQPVFDRDVPITEADEEGFFYKKLSITRLAGVLRPGLYLVDVQHEKEAASAWILVTDTALIVKRARSQILAYAVDMQTGIPLKGSRVRAYRNGVVVAHGQTDAAGIAELFVPAPKRRRSTEGDTEGDASGGDGSASQRVTTVAIRGDDEAVVDHNEYASEEGGAYTVHAYTDRPIYRPGQKIYFKGIVRHDLQQSADSMRDTPQNRYAVASDETVRVEIRDPSGERILVKKLTTNRYGSYSGSVDLTAEAPTGQYSMITKIGGTPHTHDILVSSYRKPEYEVNVTPDRSRYARGEQVSMAITAHYYFGAPVVGAKVHYSVYRSPDYGSFGEDESDPEFSGQMNFHFAHDTSEDYYGASVVEGDAVLDDTGKAMIQFKADATRDPMGPQTDIYTASVTVTEGQDREVNATGTARVTTGDFGLTVSPDGYVSSPGQPTNVLVTARDYDGHPVQNVSVQIESGYEEWKPDENGKYAFHYTDAGRLQATTGTDGRALVPITPPRVGELTLKVTAFDAKHDEIAARTGLWVAGDDGGDLSTEYSDLSVLSDRRHYSPGETARVLVNAARVGETVLLTIEGDKVYGTQTIPITKHSTIVHVPILAEYGPNVSLSGCYVRDKHYAHSETPLRVTMPQKELKLTVRADRDPAGKPGVDPSTAGALAASLARYQPGEKITYSVQANDMHGNPAECEFSFGVVDEAVYAILEDNPDALKDAFYPTRSNRVETQYSFSIAYLGDADKAEPNITARKKFPDTAFWAPDLVTDSQGRAVVSFTLPDNLTTWRATATAQTLDTKLGRATEKVISAKDFLVRLEAPRFLTQHDQTSLVAYVHNDTATVQSAQVHLKAQNLTLDAPAVQKVTIEPGKIGQVTWPVRAEGIGEASLRLTAWGTRSASGVQVTDGLETTVPIRPHGREDLTTFAGELTAAHPETEVVRLDPNAVPGISHMTVRITPSILSALTGGVDYLVGFPYGCTEQTMSRIVPDLLVQRALKSNGVLEIKHAKQIPTMVRNGLQRLYRFQHKPSGGWGWWEHDPDNPWMTAYVLYGLSEARSQGYVVSSGVIADGIKAAVKMAKDINTPLHDRAFLIYSLALCHDASDARTLRHAPLDLAKVSSEALGYMILTDKALGETSNEVIAEFGKRAELADGMLHWSADAHQRWKWDWDWDDQEATAVGLRALIALNPQDPRIAPVVRWLMFQRTDNYWTSTRDTSWVLSALCDYLSGNRFNSDAGSVAVRLNGAVIQNYALTADVQNEKEIVLRIPSAQLRPDKNDITLERIGGTSPIFYTVQMRQTVGMDNIPALSGTTGLTVKREYLRVVPKKTGDNAWSLQAEATDNALRQGDHIRVRLTINAPRDLKYVLIEDAFPSGCTVSERGTADEVVDWGYWWDSVDVRDDRIAFFARSITKGKHVIEYNLRAETLGSYRALPTLVQAMYAPEMRAETAETPVTIK